MSREKQIEFERNEIAQIIADSFKLNDEKYDASDFEWSAYQIQMADYRKEIQGEWIIERWGTHHCSSCGGDGPYDGAEYELLSKYCPHCGAYMMRGKPNE